MTNAYDKVTEFLINKISEQKTLPWHKPWRTSQLGKHSNHVTGHEYTGINSLLTSLQGFSIPQWVTFKQCDALNVSIKSGCKGTPIIYFSMIKAKPASAKTKQVNKDGKFEAFPLAKYYYAWNVEQTTMSKAQLDDLMPKQELLNNDPILACEDIIKSMPNCPKIDVGLHSAYYTPKTDIISMPDIGLFDSSEHYYGTLFHELGHATGHESRLNRKTLTEVNLFGSHDYSKEELVAEFTSAFLCSQAKIDARVIDNSAAYLQSWLKVLKDNPKWLVSAASQAQKAANYILNKKESE